MRYAVAIVAGLALTLTAAAQEDQPLTPRTLQAALDAKPTGADAEKLAERIRTYFGKQQMTRGPQAKIEPERFRGIVVDPPPMGDASLERFEAALRFHCERLNPGGELKIDPKTSRCKWLGESMDYNTAIEGMQYREAMAAGAGSR